MNAPANTIEGAHAVAYTWTVPLAGSRVPGAVCTFENTLCKQKVKKGLWNNPHQILSSRPSVLLPPSASYSSGRRVFLYPRPRTSGQEASGHRPSLCYTYTYVRTYPAVPRPRFVCTGCFRNPIVIRDKVALFQNLNWKGGASYIGRLRNRIVIRDEVTLFENVNREWKENRFVCIGCWQNSIVIRDKVTLFQDVNGKWEKADSCVLDASKLYHDEGRDYFVPKCKWEIWSFVYWVFTKSCRNQEQGYFIKKWMENIE